jgi:hypothetical protein
VSPQRRPAIDWKEFEIVSVNPTAVRSRGPRPAKCSGFRRRLVKTLAWAFLAARLFQADGAAANDLAFKFATVTQGREIISRDDDYIAQMSPFDRAVRLKTERNVSEAEYLEFLRSQVGDWSDSDKATLTPILNATRSLVADFELPWPDQIYLIKINGIESAGTRYTRANSIVLPQSDVRNHLPLKDLTSFSGIIAHELFHILSRYDPELRKKLYAAIGFVPCGEIQLPPSLAETKITNPDEPKSNYCIRVKIDGSDVQVMPFLHSRFVRYDLKRGGDLFDYLQMSFLRVPSSTIGAPTARNLSTVQFETVERLTGFYKQVGRNSMSDEQLEQPEEILADNFSLLVRGITDVPSPDIQTKIRAILDGARGSK